jgi:hypothetical protein
MPHAVEVQVVRRNLRWEVRVNGVARPRIDWLARRCRYCKLERNAAQPQFLLTEAGVGYRLKADS